LKEELLGKIERLHDLEKYQEIIDLIESLPAERLNTELIGKLASAYNNIENYAKGLELLKTIEFEEGNSFQWNRRAGYSYFFLEDFVNAEKCFLKAYELDPNDKDNSYFLIGIYTSLSRIEDENSNSEKAIEYALEAKKYAFNEETELRTNSFLAWMYDRHMEYTKAEEIIRNILGRNKDDAWACAELGYCLAGQERYEEALEYFFMAEKLNKKEIWIYKKMVTCYKHLNEKEEALKYCFKVLELDAEDRDILTDLAWLYDTTARYEEALKYLERLEELGQDDAWTNTEFGYCLSKLGRYEEAIERLNRALEADDDEDKDVAFIYARLGWCKRKLGMCDEAIEDFTQAKKWGRNDAVINAEIGHCYKAKDEYEEAIEKFEYALSLDEEKEETELAFVYGQLGWCNRHLWNFEKALEYFMLSKEKGRNDVWVNVEMALCYENLEEPEKALECALIAYELDKDDVHILSELSVIYSCMEKYEEALSFLLRAEELDRDDEWINTEIGINLGRSGKINEALERLKKSLTMVEEDDIDRRIIINSEIAWFYGKLEEVEPEVVLEYLNVARALGRDDEWIHSEMGYQLGYNPETRKEALEHFERALELGRDDAWIFEVTGTVLLNFDRYEEALDYFRKAYAKDEDGWYLYSMGECLRKLGRYEEAIEVLLESRQLSIDEDDVVDGEDLELAHSYLGIGDKDNAQKYLDLARDSIDKQGTLNDDIKEEIEEIEKGILSLNN